MKGQCVGCALIVAGCWSLHCVVFLFGATAVGGHELLDRCSRMPGYNKTFDIFFPSSCIISLRFCLATGAWHKVQITNVRHVWICRPIGIEDPWTHIQRVTSALFLQASAFVRHWCVGRCRDHWFSPTFHIPCIEQCAIPCNGWVEQHCGAPLCMVILPGDKKKNSIAE